MNIQREQNKIAKKFYSRLKTNFDPEYLKRYRNEFEYMGWNFKFQDYELPFGTYLYKILSLTETGNEVFIRPNRRIRKQITSFLRKEWKKKYKKEKLDALLKGLEPSKMQIEKTFPANTVNIYESLNN